ncbi:MAG: histidine kinase, partial [Mucilaginibacter sp.]
MKKQWNLFWHVSVWACLLSLFFSIVYSSHKVTLNYTLIIVFIYGFINIGLFYFNYLLLIPRYLDRKQYARYIIAVLLTIVIVGLIKYGIKFTFKEEMMEAKGEPLTFWTYFLSTLFTSLMFVFFSITLQFTIDWFMNERIQRDLENQRLNAELSFLKSQINPHFLFNSLNSIYSLAYQRSETTPEAILKLSEIMRYMLYE